MTSEVDEVPPVSGLRDRASVASSVTVGYWPPAAWALTARAWATRASAADSPGLLASARCSSALSWSSRNSRHQVGSSLPSPAPGAE